MGLYYTTRNLFNKYSEANVLGSLDSNYLTFPYSTSVSTARTFFFECEPNTTYTISAELAGDRLYVFTAENILDYKNATTSNKIQFDTSYIALKSDIPNIYTFTTGADDKMCGVYYTYAVEPVEMQIEKGSAATPYTPHLIEISEIKQKTENGVKTLFKKY